MWSNRIVVDPPLFDERTGIRQADEPVLAQALISELAVETFDMPILGWFARRREVERDLLLRGPGTQHLTSKLWPIVDPNALRRARHSNHAVQDAHDPSRRQRRVDFNRQTLTREAINQIECAKARSTRQRIMREIHRPMLTSARRNGEMRLAAPHDTLALSLSDGEPFGAVEPIDPFMIECTKFAP